MTSHPVPDAPAASPANPSPAYPSAAYSSPAYPIEQVRAQFPSLSGGTAYFDGPGGTQTPTAVAQAVASALTGPLANHGPLTLASRTAAGYVDSCRQAMADLLGADPGGVVVGRSMTELAFQLGRCFARRWGPGDEIVVTTLDHDGDVRPWVLAAEAAGATVRWARFDSESAELPVEAVAEQLSERTRLVAVTGASNVLGTRPDLPAIAAAVHAIPEAVFVVDGVHLTPHAPVAVDELGADLYLCSPYKFLGPHCGVAAGRVPVLEALHVDRVAPAVDTVPERFEHGTLPYELMAGTAAAVDVLAGLVPDAAPADAPRRERVLASMRVLEAYEDDLRAGIESGLLGIDGLRIHSRAARRTPTLWFDVEGIESVALAVGLAERGINAPAGCFYGYEPARQLGLWPTGAIRVGLAPYSTAQEGDRLVEAVTELVAAARR